jgi:hypothetical protein
MNRIGIIFLSVLLAGMCYGQTTTSVAAQTTPAAIGHGAFPVKVVKTLDSSKLKEGDNVEVETAGAFKLPDGTLVPKGSKLTGHVTSSKARSKGDSDSQLTVSFDKLNITNGKQLSVKGIVQAVFPPPDEPAPQMAGKASGAAGGGYVGATVGTVDSDKSGSNMESSGNGSGSIDPKAAGVQGIHNLELSDGVLTSKGKNVKLGDGVRMIVRVDILG